MYMYIYIYIYVSVCVRVRHLPAVGDTHVCIRLDTHYSSVFVSRHICVSNTAYTFHVCQILRLYIIYLEYSVYIFQRTCMMCVIHSVYMYHVYIKHSVYV